MNTNSRSFIKNPLLKNNLLEELFLTEILEKISKKHQKIENIKILQEKLSLLLKKQLTKKKTISVEILDTTIQELIDFNFYMIFSLGALGASESDVLSIQTYKYFSFLCTSIFSIIISLKEPFLKPKSEQSSLLKIISPTETQDVNDRIRMSYISIQDEIKGKRKCDDSLKEINLRNSQKSLSLNANSQKAKVN